MSHKCWALAAGLMLTLTAAVSAQEKPDPPGPTIFLSRYRAWFNLADADKDGSLDKDELAKAFRGASAKPYDYVPPPKDEKDTSEKDKSTPEKPEPKKDYSRYPDYLFLIQLDKDNDEKVSRAEFESWAVDLAVQLKSQIEAQQRLLQLQQRAEAPKLKAAEKKKLELELKREREAYHKLQQKVQRLEKHFQEARKKPPEKKR